MSDPKEQEAPTKTAPVQTPPVEEDGDEVEVEEASLYERLCEALDTKIEEDESVDEFKIRVVKDFSDMEVWTDERYEVLDKDVQDWVYDATTIHKGNITKKRKKSLPLLSGLDPEKTAKKRGRASLTDEPKRKTRTRGNDCLTRTMKELVASKKPEDLKAIDLVKTLNDKYGKEYSIAAVRYAQQAFATARELMK
jgi:hypothetical protein